MGFSPGKPCLVRVEFTRVLERSGLSHATFATCECPRSLDELIHEIQTLYKQHEGLCCGLAWWDHSPVPSGAGGRSTGKQAEDIPIHLFTLKSPSLYCLFFKNVLFIISVCVVY